MPRVDTAALKIVTRRSNDWTTKYPTIAKALAEPRRRAPIWMANSAASFLRWEECRHAQAPFPLDAAFLPMKKLKSRP
jgi:hypothetical protein